jgi:hypothetical protein
MFFLKVTSDDVCDVIGFEDELKLLLPHFVAHLKDLRSSIIKEMCRCLQSLARQLGRSFEPAVLILLPHLQALLYVTIKIISTSADECMVALFGLSCSPKTFPTLLASMTDSHAVVRQKSAEYCLLLMQACTGLSADCLEIVGGVARRAVEDSDTKTRAAGRALVIQMEGNYPAQGERLFSSLSTAVQKAVGKDRPGIKGKRFLPPSTIGDAQKTFKNYKKQRGESDNSNFMLVL